MGFYLPTPNIFKIKLPKNTQIPINTANIFEMSSPNSLLEMNIKTPNNTKTINQTACCFLLSK